MWSAIKSDLFEFISTVQEEAQETLAKVVDLHAISQTTVEDNDQISAEEKILSTFRNDYATYSEDVKSEQQPEFQKFLKSFSLSSNATEISNILEIEEGVTKHYEALVPQFITADVFWARYFFKVNILIISSLDDVLKSAYEEEEELTWGEDDEEDRSAVSSGAQGNDVVDPNLVNVNHEPLEHNTIVENVTIVEEKVPLSETDERVNQLETENVKLLTRVRELEKEVARLEGQLASTRIYRSTETEPCPPSSGSSVVDLGTTYHSEKQRATSVQSDDKWAEVSSSGIIPSASELSLNSISSISGGESPPLRIDDAPTLSISRPAKVVEVVTTTSAALKSGDVKRGEKAKAVTSRLGSAEDDEEEWDNEAWE